jgi:hypothetical protein
VVPFHLTPVADSVGQDSNWTIARGRQAFLCDIRKKQAVDCSWTLDDIGSPMAGIGALQPMAGFAAGWDLAGTSGAGIVCSCPEAAVRW